MARWITVRRRFDYRWPSGAITHFSDRDLGEHLVKDEVADFAVEKGHATEGKVDGSVRSRKSRGNRVPSRRQRRKDTSPAKAADSRSGNAVDHAHDADADRAADRQPLADDAE